MLYIHIELHSSENFVFQRPVGAGLVQLFSSDEVQMFVNASENPSPRIANLPGRNIKKGSVFMT